MGERPQGVETELSKQKPLTQADFEARLAIRQFPFLPDGVPQKDRERLERAGAVLMQLWKMIESPDFWIDGKGGKEFSFAHIVDFFEEIMTRPGSAVLSETDLDRIGNVYRLYKATVGDSLGNLLGMLHERKSYQRELQAMLGRIREAKPNQEFVNALNVQHDYVQQIRVKMEQTKN